MKKQKLKERIKALNASQKKKFKMALIMSLLCVVMLSGATYAWFTISNTAKVNNLEITVISEGKLLIGADANVIRDNKSEHSLKISTQKALKLYPCTTTTDGKVMRKPIYTASDVVTGTDSIATTGSPVAERERFYYEETIWLGINEAAEVNNKYAITLAKKNNNIGSYVNVKGTGASHPEYCIRISFTINQGTADEKTVIYEPNADVHITGTKATDNSNAGCTNTFKQNNAGTFINQSGTVYYTGDSSELFEITANQPTPVVVRIWFEGTDTDCVNEIQNGSIEGMFTFVSHKKTF